MLVRDGRQRDGGNRSRWCCRGAFADELGRLLVVTVGPEETRVEQRVVDDDVGVLVRWEGCSRERGERGVEREVERERRGVDGDDSRDRDR